MKWFFQRLIDVALCAALISGIGVLNTFAAVIVIVMVCVFALGPFVMNETLSKKLTDGGVLKSLTRFLTLAGYTAALLFSGHPYLAAAYLVAANWTLMAAYQYRDKATGAA